MPPKKKASPDVVAGESTGTAGGSAPSASGKKPRSAATSKPATRPASTTGVTHEGSTSPAPARSRPRTRAAGTTGTTTTSTAATDAEVTLAVEALPVRESKAGGRSNRTFYLPDELYARGRNAVAWTALVPGEAGSYAALTEKALRREVERLERVYNESQPFEDAQLKRGPAAGVMERVHAMRAKARPDQEEVES